MKKLNNKGFVVAGSAILGAFAVFIILLLALGVVLYLVAGVLIDTLIRIVLITTALALVLAFIFRATGFNPLSMQATQPKLDSLAMSLILAAIFIVIGIPYLQTQTMAGSGTPLDPYAFSLNQLNTSWQIFSTYWIYICLFLLVVGIVFSHEKKLKRAFRKLTN